MKFLLLISAVVGVAFSANTHGLTIDQIVDMVVRDTDINPADGVISLEEFKQELLGRWDNNPADEQVTKNEFVQSWVDTYGDNHDTTNHFFTNLDAFPDHKLTELDILLQMGQIDPNGDSVITVDEFKAFIVAKHPTSGNGK